MGLLPSEKLIMGKKGSLKIISFILIFILIVVAFYIIPMPEKELGEEAEEEEFPLFDGLLVVFGLLVTGLFAYSTKREKGILKKPLIYITASVFFFAIIRIFYFLHGVGAEASGTVLMVWWHLLFYTGIAVLMAGLVIIRDSEKNEKYKLFGKNDAAFFSILAVVFIAIFASFFFMNSFFTDILKGTILEDGGGFVHILAVTIGVFATIILIEAKASAGYQYTNVFNLFFAGTFTMYVIHTWELLTESWHIFIFPEATVETVEKIMFIFVWLFILAAFLILYKKQKKGNI